MRQEPPATRMSPSLATRPTRSAVATGFPSATPRRPSRRTIHKLSAGRIPASSTRRCATAPCDRSASKSPPGFTSYWPAAPTVSRCHRSDRHRSRSRAGGFPERRSGSGAASAVRLLREWRGSHGWRCWALCARRRATRRMAAAALNRGRRRLRVFSFSSTRPRSAGSRPPRASPAAPATVCQPRSWPARP